MKFKIRYPQIWHLTLEKTAEVRCSPAFPSFFLLATGHTILLAFAGCRNLHVKGTLFLEESNSLILDTEAWRRMKMNKYFSVLLSLLPWDYDPICSSPHSSLCVFSSSTLNKYTRFPFGFGGKYLIQCVQINPYVQYSSFFQMETFLPRERDLWDYRGKQKSKFGKKIKLEDSPWKAVQLFWEETDQLSCREEGFSDSPAGCKQ